MTLEVLEPVTRIRADKNIPHTTAQEMEFLDGLGMHREMPGDRKQLLTQYIGAAKKRAKWGDIDRDEVISHAAKLIGTEFLIG